MIATAITTIAIVIHPVTMIGDMKKQTKMKDRIKAKPIMFVFIGWCLAFVIPLLFKPGDINRDEKDTLNFYEISFLSASALFTGIAFAVTFSSLEHQKDSLKNQIDLSNKQIDLDLFSETIRLVMDDDKFITSRKYIYSPDFYRDIEEVGRIVNKGKESLELGDFRRIIHSNDSQITIGKETKERLRKAYEKITYFCSRMEYLGLIFNEKGAETLIMEYYGRTILESYRNLHDIIENSRNQDKMKRLYLYYSKLYASAENKEKEILESIPNSEG